MAMRLRNRLVSPAIAGALLLLLGALATLQYRWIGRVSDMERQRMHESLQASGARFTEDFDRELTRAFFMFHPEPAQPSEDGMQRAVRQLQRWRTEAPWPRLVKDLLVARRRADGTLELFRLAASAHRFEPAPWPAQLSAFREHLLAKRPGDHVPFPFEIPINPDLPGLVIPLVFLPPPETMTEESFLVVQLDKRVLIDELFPELTRRHFGSPKGTDYSLAVLDAAERPIFRSDAKVPLSVFHQADLRLGMLSLRPFHEVGGVWHHRQAPRLKRANATFVRFGPMGFGDELRNAGHWHLAIHHRQGSLEAAVTAARKRNLGISLGILTLLAATSGLMVVTTQRAQRLAQQQIEFVAGVTHELHTPLTAIRSAGQNLADGVVMEPQQVRRYGSLIEREGRRLSDMVGQVLELAGIQSGRRVYNLQPEAVRSLIDGALDDCRGLLEEKRAQVEKDVPADLPPVLVDEAALRRALRNLIENAVRHGNGHDTTEVLPWIGVRARSVSGAVEITVEDHGPGIPREDLPHLFEPFYRGRGSSSNGVPGSGLGLSVVRHVAEALGGRVNVVTEEGQGSAFTLHLPAAPAGAKTA
jgi:signal transduction histidine kinase